MLLQWSVFIPLGLLLQIVSAFHFYLEGSQQKCFFQELGEGSLLVGKYEVKDVTLHPSSYHNKSQAGIRIGIHEINERELVQYGYGSNQFMYTSDRIGEYRICFKIHAKDSTYFRIRLSLDLTVGQSEIYESNITDALDGMTKKARMLNEQIYEIRLAQMMMRERETEFRYQSEMTNTKVIKYALVQLIVLVSTSIWQIVHLQGFFIKQKLV